MKQILEFGMRLHYCFKIGSSVSNQKYNVTLANLCNPAQCLWQLNYPRFTQASPEARGNHDLSVKIVLLSLLVNGLM